MFKKFFYTLFTLLISLHLLAQNPSPDFEANYRTAKQLMEQGKYGLAMQSFKKLLTGSENNDLVPYAQYYLGYSAYQAGDLEFAKNAFLQLTIKNEDWKQIDTAYLWLSKIGFEQSGPFKGMLYANKIKSESIKDKSNLYLDKALMGLQVDDLASLNQEYPNNKIIAEKYATALSKLPNSDESNEILNQLIEQFGLNRSQFNKIPESKFKDQYDIGILLPFFIDRVEASGKYLQKSLAIDIYEGAKMAVCDVDSTLFNLFVFDSKKDTIQLNTLLTEGGLKNMDAILGPLYPDPLEKMISFASANHLNFVNPTSSNPYISESSPYAFLSRASADQLAKKAAAYMKTQPVNKNLFIYYGSSDVDSISAYVYKQEMEADSFDVVITQKIGPENRRQVYDGLTASVTVPDQKKIDKMTREEIEKSIQLPTMDSLLIQPDSIGHIFIASSDLTLPTEAMSAIISRGDSIKIMGVGNWFESQNAGLSIMEGLGVTLAISTFDDISSDEFIKLTNRYIEMNKKIPSKYFFRGYYAMKFIALSLKHYGTYFQNGYHLNGNFDQTMDFENTNSNGSIKIVKMVDNRIHELEVTQVNSDSNEDSSKY